MRLICLRCSKQKNEEEIFHGFCHGCLAESEHARKKAAKRWRAWWKQYYEVREQERQEKLDGSSRE